MWKPVAVLIMAFIAFHWLNAGRDNITNYDKYPTIPVSEVTATP